VSWIDFSRWDLPALREAWRAARPFPHLVLDDLLTEEDLVKLRNAVAREPHQANVEHFYETMASGLPMLHPVLNEFAAAVGSDEALAAIREVTGQPVARVEMRSYVYLAGSFLLPHSDYGSNRPRLVAYAYYLLPRETCTGGELDLYECDVDPEEGIVATRLAKTIEPRGNRLVLFEVSPTTLHQVREVTEGGRVSLSGWFIGAEGPA
jgi:Rps23 Pro-64 3,4-dihydroxylase Tpa1-like proline 4-hydroxylase